MGGGEVKTNINKHEEELTAIINRIETLESDLEKEYDQLNAYWKMTEKVTVKDARSLLREFNLWHKNRGYMKENQPGKVVKGLWYWRGFKVIGLIYKNKL